MKQRVYRTRCGAIGVALSAVVSLAAPAMTLAGDGHSGRNWPCIEDVKTLCPDARSRDDVRRCLREHADQLSPACADKLAARRERHAAVRNACQSDLTAFCPDAQGRDIRHCLHEHRSELSATCSQTLESLPHHCSETAPS